MPKRKRVVLDTSDESKPSSPVKGKENVPKRPIRKSRKIITGSKLLKETRKAVFDENLRRKRLLQRQREYNQGVIEMQKEVGIINIIFEKDPLIKMENYLTKTLKSHQIDAVKFLWDCVVESVPRHLEGFNKERGCHNDVGGAILAHSMGLGKTLTIIAFIHTLLKHQDTLKIKKVLILSPVNTILNWMCEWKKWIPSDHLFPLFDFSTCHQNSDRFKMLTEWKDNGGILLMGYDIFRNLAQGKRIHKSSFDQFVETALLTPGPDIVVCDEGHIIKNYQGGLFKVVNSIRSQRRIVLTGTPLQNNLDEYHTLVEFIKPQLLGSKQEFRNRFVNPITNGQHSSSTPEDVRFMKMRAHVLYKMLDGCVQRKDYSEMTKILLPRTDYVIRIRLTEIQTLLYKKYLDIRHTLYTHLRTERKRVCRLFADQQNLYRVWTHPYTLRLHENRQQMSRLDILDEFINDEEDDVSLESSTDDDDFENLSKFNKSYDKISKSNVIATRSTSSTSVLNENTTSPSWWHDLYEENFQDRLDLSNKLLFVFHLLRKCGDIGDKVLLFSQSLFSLDLIEKFLDNMHEYFAANDPNNKNSLYDHFKSDIGLNSWIKGRDYDRMDGSTSIQIRKNIQDAFNDADNYRFRLFLISTRAGGLGINLIAANRVVIFDSSWNPSHDIQSIFRCYRFGQQKPVYIYRLVARGTMEEKIYDRQVTKQSLSRRVVDEEQIERHFTEHDLRILYEFEEDIYDPLKANAIPKLPKDRLLAELLSEQQHLISNYHDHDKLLENKEDEKLTEEERLQAWETFEKEKQSGQSTSSKKSSDSKAKKKFAKKDKSNKFNRFVPHGVSTSEAETIFNELKLKVYRENPDLHDNANEFNRVLNERYHQEILNHIKV